MTKAHIIHAVSCLLLGAGIGALIVAALQIARNYAA